MLDKKENDKKVYIFHK